MRTSWYVSTACGFALFAWIWPSLTTAQATVQASESTQAVAPPPPVDPYTLHTADGRFTLRIGAQIQFRYVASDAQNRGDRNAFQMRQVRPQLRGQLGVPWITYFIQPELAGTPKMLDLELTVQPWKAAGLKLGQFLTPFSRTFTTPVPKLLFPDFSLANDFFRADRDTGAMIFGSFWSGIFEYYAGVFNGNRINNTSNDDDKLIYVGRIAVNPLGHVTYDETPALSGKQPFALGIGFNAYRAEQTLKQSVAATTAEPAKMIELPTDYNTTLGTDVTVRYWLLTLQAEGYYRFADPGTGKDYNARGGYAHASSFVYWPYVELAARVSYLDPNMDAPRDTTTAYEGMLNLYAFGNNLKLNLRYTRFVLPPRASTARDMFTAQVQAYF